MPVADPEPVRYSSYVLAVDDAMLEYRRTGAV